MEIEAWHAVESEPAAGTRLERPARVELFVSTGPPKRQVPPLDGLDANQASDALRSAGFAPVIEERPDPNVAPGTILGIAPSPGARVPLGSTVTIAVARSPRWEAISTVEGTEDTEPEPLVVPAGARLVLTTVDTSPLGLWGGRVKVKVDHGQAGKGEAEVGSGEAIVIADVSDVERTIDVELDVDGPVHWTLAVEVQR
jgi:beta-lactam-binding protein with PASTA domain